MSDDTDHTQVADAGAEHPEAALAREIRRRRHAAGLSQSQLAIKVGYSRQYVSRAERPSCGLAAADLVAAIDATLRAAGALVELHAGLRRERIARREVSRTKSPTLPRTRTAPTTQAQAAARSPGAVDAIAVTGIHGTPGPRAGDAASGEEQEVAKRRGRRRDLFVSSAAHLDEVMAHLRDQWHVLVRTDNLLGPRFAIAGVLDQIATIEELCSSLRGPRRLALVRLGAQYAESAAWLYEDAGDIVKARYWTGRAMELAHEGDDDRMVAWTIFRRAQQAAAALDSAHAIGFAQAARRHEERLATPTRAAIRVQEAYGHALDGDERTAQNLLDDAHTWAATDTAGDAHEGHGSYCTPSYIEIQRANCWMTTGKPEKAVSLYEESLGVLPVVYQRSRAAALSRLAIAYLAVGQLEQAAGAAHAALPVARSGGSIRIVDELKGVGRELTPHRQHHEIAALLADLTDDEEA